jgi:steroid 5-alpha reductase family enzyme
MARNEIVFVVGILFGAGVLLVLGQPFYAGLAAAVAMFSLVWLLSLPLRNASIVDIFWGPALAALGWLYLVLALDRPMTRGLVACLLASLWALRLALHIAVRNAGHGEDFRYRAWREQAGPSFWWVSLFKVFLLQAVVAWIVASPLAFAQRGQAANALSVLDLFAVGLWAFGFFYEAIADWQLMRFKRNPANQGQVLTTGLWGLSRHPNYFGEAVLWWGLGLIGVAGGGPLALIGPALLTFSLLRVSGVAMLDRALVDRRPGYAEYLQSTPAFFPRLTRRSNQVAAR